MSDEPSKDEARAHPVARGWRPVLRSIVDALAQGDHGLSRAPDGVAPVRPEVAAQIEAYLRAHGETIVALPDAAWEASVSQWMGTHWEVLVDLWTDEAGASDLVLHVRVFERDAGYVFEVDSVHVP